ncbi:hypothetical protein [Neobacillus sp. CF12]|nr:hypothetical protein [Neobacillus sp. CF12]MDM5330563.1 hypothetical protein [Neobacillus sp. CF12]
MFDNGTLVSSTVTMNEALAKTVLLGNPFEDNGSSAFAYCK